MEQGEMMIELKLGTEFLYKASCVLQWMDAADFLGVTHDDFVGAMWENFDYTGYLQKIINDQRVTIHSVEVKDGYGQGEWFVWFKKIELTLDGERFTMTNPANSIFDDNYYAHWSIERNSPSKNS